MKNYKNLIEAINDLRKQGYEEDLEIKDGKLNSISSNFQLHPEQFNIDEVYRFEGETNPDDSSVIYAISSKHGKKGILVDAYGVYAENMTPDLAAKLNRS
ncbi:phosphoribosylpyrophosphate synthetase [Chryseobacterium taichungense]|uniref:phosphoribosylpyrophosphate synthetase n=1 Tax=Chryseobacterium taichungense TaxID=295069 RepID=UPI0028AB0F12|nr:phosphoribosylpyrophosphate synthetase [Chryseobacterium taichungense]